MLRFLGSVMRNVFPSAMKFFAPVIAINLFPPICSRIVFAMVIVFSSLSFDKSIIYLRKYKSNRQNAQTYGSIIVHFIYLRKNKKKAPETGAAGLRMLCSFDDEIAS